MVVCHIGHIEIDLELVYIRVFSLRHAFFVVIGAEHLLRSVYWSTGSRLRERAEL